MDSIELVLQDMREGKPIIVTDDADRENEGDLVIAAEKSDAANINFMIRFARGLICAPITRERADKLGLAGMVADNRESFKTDFTVSVDARDGITTGISAEDRAKTIRLLADPKTRAEDLVQPGHIFPLRAKVGGVLQRSGHTEAGVDLARLAGLAPAAVICEIINDDGTMARLPDLLKFKKKHKLKLCTIRDLIEYRRRQEKLVELMERTALPTAYGNFELLRYRVTTSHDEHLALVKGDIADGRPVLVRVHGECVTGDVFGSCRCNCGGQLQNALRKIAKEGRGVLLYMRQKSGSPDFPATSSAAKVPEAEVAAVKAKFKPGFPSGLREYGLGAQMLADLGVKRIRLITDHPKKVVGLEAYGLEIVETLSIRMAASMNGDHEHSSGI